MTDERDGAENIEGAADERSVDESIDTRRHRLRLLALASGILLVIALRSPQVLLLPSLEAEDGTFVFQHFYTHRGFAEIFRFKSGYVPLVANIVGYLAVRLPTRVIPYGFTLIPLAFTLVAYTWLFGRRFRGALGPDSTRALICFLFALAPLAQWHLLAHDDYSIWNTLLLLVLLSAIPLPTSRARKIAAWLATNLLVWSHPLAIVVAPFVAIRIARDGRDRTLQAVTLANLILHQSIGVESSGIFAGMALQEIVAKLLRAASDSALAIAATGYRASFGPTAYAWTVERSWLPVAVWSIALVALAVHAARSEPRIRPILAVVAYYVVTLTFASVLSRGPQVLEQLNAAPRYVYLQSLGFLVVLVLLVEWAGPRLVERFTNGWDRSRRVVFAVVIAWYVGLNCVMGYFFVWQGSRARPSEMVWGPYVQSHPDNGPIVRDFFATLARLESESPSRESISLSADKKNDWPITIGPSQGPRRRRSSQ